MSGPAVSPYYLSPEGKAAVRRRARELKDYLQSLRRKRVMEDLAAVLKKPEPKKGTE